MKQISKLFFVAGVLGFSLVLGGCSLVAKPADVQTESPVVSLTGKILVSGEKSSIQVGGKLVEITSRKVDLKSLNGKEVTVTGEYSGTTLYVDEAK